MSASCPFDPLIVARRVRRDAAMNAVGRCRARVAECELSCTMIRARLELLGDERRRCRQRLGELIGAAASPLELNRADERSGLLAVRAAEVQGELNAAERVLNAARKDLGEAVGVFFRAEAKLDALNRQKTAWLRARSERQESIEEAAAEDLAVHRIVSRR